MLKIGEFAQLAQVTVKTLHHYDRLGLLNPAHIDRYTSYRYYTVEQLPRIHRIVALKELGLSLEQIDLMLDEEVPTEQIRGMLRLKQNEMQQQLRETRRQLAMIEFRLRMIEAETEFPQLDVVMKRLDPLRVLSFFAETGRKQADGPHSMSRVAETLNSAIAKGIIQHTGVTIDVFHGETMQSFMSPNLHDRQHEILLGVPAGQQAVTLDELGPMTIRDEPAIEMAATLMLVEGIRAPEEPYLEKVTLLRRWAIAHGYQPAGLVRYFHHRGPLHTLNRDEFVIEAQLPVDMTPSN